MPCTYLRKFGSIAFGFLLLCFNAGGALSEEQKVVLITGTASGIGKATAEYLIEKGHIVYGGDIQFEKNRYLDGIGGHSIDMDVTDLDMVKAGVDRVIAEQGRIDVLVNNAGFGLYAPVEETTEEDMRYQFEVNVFGVANVTRAVLPYMRPARSGKIINISSMGGKIYMPLGAWYHATKHAIEGWSDCLRLELKEFDIDVVIIEPGLINTNFGRVTADYMQKYVEETAYGHFIDPFVAMAQAMEDPEAAAEMGADPIIIAKVIDEAIDAEKPKTRYVKGPMAGMAIRYRAIFGDRAFDDLILQMVIPETRKSLDIGTNTLAYFNDGWDLNLTYNTGLWRFGLSHTDMDFSSSDGFEDNRKSVGVYAGLNFLLAQTGPNFGVGFDYVYENSVRELADDKTVRQSLDRDQYRAYVKLGWVAEFVRVSDMSLYLEPGVSFAYEFGDDDLTFDSGATYESNGFEVSPSVNVGAKLRF
jgi:NAD(P)-dependent dehydrogenase (short-subunit alcohol dehydrogenase family)